MKNSKYAKEIEKIIKLKHNIIRIAVFSTSEKEELDTVVASLDTAIGCLHRLELLEAGREKESNPGRSF
ncbi:hypothetical protein [uncultured Dialister sp.]|uniref:hypothetical protein n=1 Tax=uncultured Dialister sp. TaxID=278064 RepID=UPI0026DB6F39|nr:hypothetical protein [uncultured Dialister sp.]